MKSWKSMVWAVMLSAVFPLGLVYWQPSLFTCLLLGIWVAAVLAFSFFYNRRQYEEELRIQEKTLQQAANRTLNHHRHDWMNDLQVLYGYIQLGKPDKSVQCVERIKERIALDSRIAKLGVPSLVFYLQSFRTFRSNLELDIQVEEGLQLEDKLSAESGAELTSVIMQTVRAYQYSGVTPQGDTRKLELSFSQEGRDILISFKGEGEQGNPELLQGQIYNIVQGKIMKAEQIQPAKGYIELRLPLEM
ncbi:Spo0B domain-containing protein [Paenibacillus tritici]|jgi:stage 0 sporulation protein B (sporulation initiation phosphotransferase)|uniref:Spo0B domain-containing protein n=1 Tax=Paenibacillus tritici TaxID=1873425 RepID=A0ABX2DMX1_9BACL|nr:Spo0B domain-containing protein [Paenibacillus tritici]NQX45967.1 Spo0B domain-containing protein [Paenibacillus tritici]